MGFVHRNGDDWSRRLLIGILCVPVTALTAVTGCGRDNPLNEPHEPFEMVETTLEEAISTAQSEVPEGELTSVRIRLPEPASPAWESRLVLPGEEVHSVSIDAVDGHVLDSAPEPGVSSAEAAKLLDLLEKARLPGGEAARQATDTTDGRVTGLELKRSEGEVIWSVALLDKTHEAPVTHEVDAMTGEVLDRHVP